MCAGRHDNFHLCLRCHLRCAMLPTSQHLHISPAASSLPLIQSLVHAVLCPVRNACTAALCTGSDLVCRHTHHDFSARWLQAQGPLHSGSGPRCTLSATSCSFRAADHAMIFTCRTVLVLMLICMSSPSVDELPVHMTAVHSRDLCLTSDANCRRRPWRDDGAGVD